MILAPSRIVLESMAPKIGYGQTARGLVSRLETSGRKDTGWFVYTCCGLIVLLLFGRFRLLGRFHRNSPVYISEVAQHKQKLMISEIYSKGTFSKETSRDSKHFLSSNLEETPGLPNQLDCALYNIESSVASTGELLTTANTVPTYLVFDDDKIRSL